MPAVTVEDPTRLPRITLSTGGTTPPAKDRPVKGVSTAPRGFEGEGFPVRRAFAGADLADLELLLLGGRPIREPVAWMGPFVMNTEEEIHEAIADFRAGRLGEVPAVHGAPKDLVMQTDSSLD